MTNDQHGNRRQSKWGRHVAWCILWSSLAATNTIANTPKLSEGEQADTSKPAPTSDDKDQKAKVEFFGVEGTGSKIVFLVDRSASMDGNPMAAAKRQLSKSLESLDQESQFQIIFFDTDAKPLKIEGRRRLAFASQSNKQTASELITKTEAQGGTDRLRALLKALRLGPDVVFFLTDADSPMSEVELADVARENRRYHASICTIEFGRGPDPKRYNFLKALAEKTGGQYGYVNTRTLRAQ